MRSPRRVGGIMASFQFNAVLLRISNQLSEKQVEEIKFLCPDIKKRDQESIDAGIKLFQMLTQRNKLGPDNREYLCGLLEQVQRPDLSQELRSFEPEAQSPEICDQPDDAERAKLNIATEVISEYLGKKWRRLGRKLGLSDVRLDSINNKHPTDLVETAVELLREWRKIQGAEAKTETLIDALRACELNLTADRVKSKLGL